MDVWVSLVSYGLLDSLNPSTIATVIVLLPLVKQRWHVSLFIWGTFVTYLALGLTSFYGANAYLKTILLNFYQHYQPEITYLKIFVGVLLLLFFVFKVIQFIRQPVPEISQKPLAVRSVHPVTLAGLSVVATLQDFPTALPYFWFIAIAVNHSLSWAVVVLFFALYCLLYVLPLLLLMVSYNRFRQKFVKIEHWVQQATAKALVYGIPILLLIAGLWLLADAVPKL